MGFVKKARWPLAYWLQELLKSIFGGQGPQAVLFRDYETLTQTRNTGTGEIDSTEMPTQVGIAQGHSEHEARSKTLERHQVWPQNRHLQKSCGSFDTLLALA